MMRTFSREQNEALGHYLRRLRRWKYRQEDMAHIAGLSQSSYARAENGQSSMPWWALLNILEKFDQRLSDTVREAGARRSSETTNG
jgi:transcriptional regulator with XRE-family HTH domain